MPTPRASLKVRPTTLPIVTKTRSSGVPRTLIQFSASPSLRSQLEVQHTSPLIQSRYLSFGGMDERRSQHTHHNTTMARESLLPGYTSLQLLTSSDQTFPSDLPVPKDDGACDHLIDSSVSSAELPIARDPAQRIDLSKQTGLTIVFCYPRTGAPNETVPDSWNAIPGARGCTPQACSFRDAFSKITSLGVSQVFGLSTQSSSYQAEVHGRLHLPYELLSDENLEFQKAMNLPTFDWEGGKVIRRLTLAILGGKVVKVWYPVFPPDKATDEVVSWLMAKAINVRGGPPTMLATGHVA